MAVLTDKKSTAAAEAVAPVTAPVLERIPFELELSYRPVPHTLALLPTRINDALSAARETVSEMPNYENFCNDPHKLQSIIVAVANRALKENGYPEIDELGMLHAIFRKTLEKFITNISNEDRQDLVSIGNSIAPDDAPHTAESALIKVLELKSQNLEIA